MNEGRVMREMYESGKCIIPSYEAVMVGVCAMSAPQGTFFLVYSLALAAISKTKVR